jgi:aminoglycoside phosphotransferase (APT) family kinase protein
MTETRPVRQGEEIDIERLRAYLEGELGTLGAIEIEQFPGGSSNLTYLVRMKSISPAVAVGDLAPQDTCQSPRVSKGDTPNTHFGTQEYVLRRPPFGNTVKTAHDMRREFEVLSKLSAVYDAAPKPLIFCTDESVIGSDFYLMERRHGLIIRGQIPGTQSSEFQLRLAPSERESHLKVELQTFGTQGEPVAPLDLETSKEARRRVCRSFIAGLVKLHTLDYKSAGLETLGRIEGYNRRQVEGWTRRYFAAKTHDHDALEKTIEWLNASIPAESGASLVHNDYKFDNVMLDPSDLGRITAVLDWEMVTIGDPLMDLGTTLGYWMSRDAGEEMLSMPFNPRVLMENISRQELVEMYEESLGRKLPDMRFYYVFGTFKIAVIAQQIYARYVRGFTKDERFAGFDRFVEALGRIAALEVTKRSV